MPSIAQIKRSVAEEFGVTVADIDSARRHQSYTVPRQVCFYLARKLTSQSFPQIGHAIGTRDHTTVINGLKSLSQRMAGDADLKKRVAKMEIDLCGMEMPEINTLHLDMPFNQFVEMAKALGYRVKLEVIQ